MIRMKPNTQWKQGFALLLLSSLVGCVTEIAETEPLVCEPGIRKCDETSTKILECHANGAAWTLHAYCPNNAFCVNESCTGDGANSFEAQGNPGEGFTTGKNPEEDASVAGEGREGDTSVTEEDGTPDEVESPEDDGIAEPPSDTADSQDTDPENETETAGSGENDGSTDEDANLGEDIADPIEDVEGSEQAEEEEETSSLPLFIDTFDEELAITLEGSSTWTPHYCEDLWMIGGGSLSAQKDDGCGVGQNPNCCPYGSGTEEGPETGICSSAPINNFVTHGATDWDNYTLDVAYNHDDDDAIGAVFRFQDNDNYYLFSMTNDRINNPEGCSEQVGAASQILKVRQLPTDSQPTVAILGSSSTAYIPGEPGTFRIVADDTLISVFLQVDTEEGIWTEVMSVTDSEDSLLSGSVGLYMFESGLENCDDHCGFSSVIVLPGSHIPALNGAI